jgi:hypothetical protein
VTSGPGIAIDLAGPALALLGRERAHLALDLAHREPLLRAPEADGGQSPHVSRS